MSDRKDLFAVLGDSKEKEISSVKDYAVVPCSVPEIREFVETWHYSKNLTGVSTRYNFKLLDLNKNLVGAMVYGPLGMASVWKRYVDKKSDVIELRRLCCIDDTPKNTESYFIAQTIKWLHQNTNIKKIVSYADLQHGHEGTIYKASNFDLIGQTVPCKMIRYRGRIYHEKGLRNYKKNGQLQDSAKNLAKALETGEAEMFWTKEKNIYVYDLTKNKKKSRVNMRS